MLDENTYQQYRAAIERANAWVDTQRGRNGWASYVAKDAPDYVQAVTNEMRSAVECYELARDKPGQITAYLSSDMRKVTTWTGEELGDARVVKSWAMPHSWRSSRQYQVECVINGVLYTGRSMGGGMLWSGKRKAEKLKKPQRKPYEIVETVDGEFMVLIDGLQWGAGPRDKSGASSQTWPTREAAQTAIEQEE